MYVELFGRPKFEILADLITQQNALTIPLNASYLSFGDITAATVPGTEDRVSVQVIGRSPVTGQKTFTYSRIDLGKLLDSVSPTVILPVTATTVADILPLLKVKYNIFIDAVDIANADTALPFIPEGTTAIVTLQTKATTTYNSHVWSGNLDIICSGGSTTPSGSLLAENGAAIQTEASDFIVTEQTS